MTSDEVMSDEWRDIEGKTHLSAETVENAYCQQRR